jgi:thiamine biosynthesis lipoprotein
MTEADSAVESPRVSFRSHPRAGRRLATSTVLWAFVAGNAGGDMRLAGRAVPELGWSVGIQHPLRRDAIAAVVNANDLAVATSGAYARGDHVRNPHTGRAPTGVLSVTVVGPDLATADAYATAAFAMGPVAGPHWTGRLKSYEAMTILADETILSTGGFPNG